MEQRRSSQSFKRKELVGKLNPVCLRAFKAAADTAKLRGNPYVELVHFIDFPTISFTPSRKAGAWPHWSSAWRKSAVRT